MGQVARQLRDLIASSDRPQNAGPDIYRRRDAFLLWVHDIEVHLNFYFTRVPLEPLGSDN